jgi:hypothetical protein
LDDFRVANFFYSLLLCAFLVTNAFVEGCLALGAVGTLKIQKITFSDLNEDTGYVAKIRFLPIGEGYKGGIISLDTIRYSPEYGQMYVESTLLIDVPEDERVQLWTLGPWCAPVEKFVYSVYGPRRGEAFDILDEDGFLTRGILTQLRNQWSSQHDPMTLKTFALDGMLGVLEDYLDTICYFNASCLFSRRKNFDASDLMYYQKVSQDNDGQYRTIRIRPSNHDYVMDRNDWLLNLGAQSNVFEAIVTQNRQRPTLMVGVEGVKVDMPNCRPMDTFLDPATLDNVRHTNYVRSKLAVTSITERRCVFQWAIFRPHGTSHEERHVRLDSNVSIQHVNNKHFREQKISLYKVDDTRPFLTIGPVYTALCTSNPIPDIVCLGQHEYTFFRLKIEKLLQDRNMSFLRYLDR